MLEFELSPVKFRTAILLFDIYHDSVNLWVSSFEIFDLKIFFGSHESNQACASLLLPLKKKRKRKCKFPVFFFSFCFLYCFYSLIKYIHWCFVGKSKLFVDSDTQRWPFRVGCWWRSSTWSSLDWSCCDGLPSASRESSRPCITW